jgi:GNAT superfamily N-acetyltransferase
MAQALTEDLFTLKSAWRRAVATATIVTIAERLRPRRAPVFLGAFAGEEPKRLYARLGFHPVTLARTWVRELHAAGEGKV